MDPRRGARSSARGAEAAHGRTTPLTDAGRGALQDLRVLATLTVAALLAVLGLVQWVLDVPDDDGRARLAEADGALAEVQRAEQRVLFLFYQLLATPEPMSDGLLAARLTSASAEAGSAWKQYRDLALPVRDEQELAASYMSDVEEGKRFASESLGEPRTFGTDHESLRWRLENIAAGLAGTGKRLDALTDLRSRYTTELDRVAAEREQVVRTSRNVLFATCAAWILLVTSAVLVAGRRGGRRVERLETMQQDLDRRGRASRIEAELNRALEMTETEDAAYQVVQRALESTLGERTAELLVADSSLAHLQRTVTCGDSDFACGVSTARSCPAVRRGHTQEFADTSSLDACPHLAAGGSAHGSLCTPLAIGGVTSGVLRIALDEAGDVDASIVELIVRKVGERAGVLRAFARSESQARTDPLTGLLNRRSLEDHVRSVTASGGRFAVAFADLDHFKLLNDIHGHDAGDRALRLFASTLRNAIRPSDVAARYGGEEFVVVLPDCDVEGVLAVIDRVTTALSEALGGGSVPRFTASFGVTDASTDDFLEAVARADEALLAAKRSGRNRSVVWTPELRGSVDDRSTVARDLAEASDVSGLLALSRPNGVGHGGADAR